MLTVSAGAAKPGSVSPSGSAFGQRVVAEPTPLQARRWFSPRDRSRRLAHGTQTRASARGRPALPRCHTRDTATSALLFLSADSRRSRHPGRIDIGKWPCGVYLLAATHPIPLAAGTRAHSPPTLASRRRADISGLAAFPETLDRRYHGPPLPQPLIGKKLRDADEHYFVSSGTATGTDSGRIDLDQSVSPARVMGLPVCREHGTGLSPVAAVWFW
ncbi:MAG: hypothetical protein QOE41_4307 [Mycobacterium sp.]|jgi:hypothetical protein|nr:hypothetical protein [Mycobacterium sp.]MDT5134996.1 hypothetical protein [Mycobacterium sp.]